MPKPKDFTLAQARAIQSAARGIWYSKFASTKAVKATGALGGQDAMAAALGVSQQVISALLDLKDTSTPAPGIAVATAIADYLGITLDDLKNGRHSEPQQGLPPGFEPVIPKLPNLDACLKYNADQPDRWGPWTIAAARAAFFGNADFRAREWEPKLDMLEKALERARKAG